MSEILYQCLQCGENWSKPHCPKCTEERDAGIEDFDAWFFRNYPAACGGTLGYELRREGWIAARATSTERARAEKLVELLKELFATIHVNRVRGTLTCVDEKDFDYILEAYKKRMEAA